MSLNNYYDPATCKELVVAGTANEPICVPHVATTSSDIPESMLKRLVDQGFTRSLARSLNETKRAFALRIWVIDNSGSMRTRDGHRIVDTGKSDVSMVDCSRWGEISECVEYHIQLADTIDAPTRFRFLNNPGRGLGPQKFAIKESSYAHQLPAHEAISLMRKVLPGGCTPLTEHILEIYTEVFEMLPELRRTGQKVAIILATVSFYHAARQLTDSSCPTIFTHTYSFISPSIQDGLPSNKQGFSGAYQQNEFVEKLRLLEGLPVWVVIRLCTVRIAHDAALGTLGDMSLSEPFTYMYTLSCFSFT
jgi:hypothetical protein